MNLESFNNKNWRIKIALKQVEKLETIEKEEDMSSIISSPAYQNIVHILGPLAIYYKVDQVLKLLKEMGSDINKPQAPMWGTPQYLKDKLY